MYHSNKLSSLSGKAGHLETKWQLIEKNKLKLFSSKSKNYLRRLKVDIENYIMKHLVLVHQINVNLECALTSN